MPPAQAPQTIPLLGDALNVDDLETLARSRLPEAALGYYASGAWDEVTLRENRAAFERVRVHYRCLVDVSRRDLSTEVLGCRMSMPVVIAPTAFHGMATPEGELATARAAVGAGVVMTVSTLATRTFEEVAAANAGRGPLWFQLYIAREREFTRDMLARAEASGYRAVVFTVDTPEWGRRERDVRNAFHLPPGLSAVNLARYSPEGAAMQHAGRGMGQAFPWMISNTLTWADLDWLRGQTRLPVLVKGICRADDAARAVAHGAAAIIVSNHGGRQMDGAPATVEVLPEIVAAVSGRVPVLLDGGVRRGTDVLKALALGAKAVLVGRPILWGLAVAGEDGARAALEFLRAELDLAMALAGCPDVASITPDLVRVGPGLVPPVASPR